MSDIESFDPRTLTFSQTYGYEELPRPLALGELSEDARLEIWNLLYLETSQSSTMELDFETYLHDPWLTIFRTLHQYFLKKSLDTFSDRVDRIYPLYKIPILEGLPFNMVFDLLLIILRHSHCPTSFSDEVVAIFERNQLAYFVDTNGPPTIVPAATTQEGEAIGNAIETFQDAGLGGTETHLRNAIDLFNQEDWAGSIRESIHSVESVARYLDSSQADSLGAALNSLERRYPLHPALKKGFSSIYGYTSDEEGIRHSLVDNSESPAGRDEAIFMLGACASFASYLWRVGQATS